MTIRHLEILGGEPFLDSAHFTLLERLIDVGNTDLHLIYTTNGQQMPSLRLSKLLSKFAKVQINLSIDGKDKVFDYMRYPGKWETLEEVLKQLQQTNWKISAYATLSNLNVFYFDELLEWIVKNFQLSDFNYQFVYEPSEMSVNVMPVSMKEKIQHKFLNHKLATFLKPVLDTVMFPCEVDLIDKLKTTVKQQDTFRKQDPKDFVPEIVEYLY
jgi:sulfatase maturation enzyme AslB (radical SAM superfamily)